MSTDTKAGASRGKSADDFMIPAGSAWASRWKSLAVIGALGLGLAVLGRSSDPTRFAYSYLFGYIAALTLPLGCLFFILLERLTGANWSVVVRRTAEFFVQPLWVFIVLAIPIFMNASTLFPWWSGHEAHPQARTSDGLSLVTQAYAQTAPPPVHMTLSNTHGPLHLGLPPGALPGSLHTAHTRAHGVESARPVVDDARAEKQEFDELMHKKAAWIGRDFFLARAAFYVLFWAALGYWLFRLSTDQDRYAKDVPAGYQYTVRAQRIAPVATLVLGLTLTFAAFDWIMALEPTWFSTIFGVTIFAGSIVVMYSTLILVTLALKNAGLMPITVEHYHDLGKLLFGFLIFWGYASFAQFMLIWYAALPEETTFYHARWDAAPWDTVSLAIIWLHFVIPFFLILSRNSKRKLGMLAAGAVCLIVMHVVEIYWFVMPNFTGGKPLTFSLLDVACLVGIVCVYLALVLRAMKNHPLIPIGDPRLSRSLAFENA